MKCEGEIGKHTLFINTWSSTCGNCGEGADPEERTHITCLGYGEQPPGCGVEWKYVSTNYSGLNMENRLKRMRPDLKYKDFFEVITAEPKAQEKKAA